MYERKPKRYDDLDQVDLLKSTSDEEIFNEVIRDNNSPNKRLISNNVLREQIARGVVRNGEER